MQNYPGYPPQPPRYPQQGYTGYSAPHAPAPPLIPTSQPTIGIPGEFGPFGVTPSLIPGPFILLLILPLIPLLLFSLGARPPDTSHLPFTTSDVFTTGAFITITGTIVLCLGVYPEAGGAVWGFIKDGGKVDKNYWKGFWSWTGVTTETIAKNENAVKRGVRARSIEQKWMMKWHFDERYRRWIKIRVPAPMQNTGSHLRPNTKGIHSLATRHLNSLRKSFPTYYSEYKPKLVPLLLIISFILFLLILLIGGILGSAYDSDSKSSSTSSERKSSSSKLPSWVERELRKRKEEKPEVTLKRITEESKKEIESYKKMGDSETLKKYEKKRNMEKEVLKKELKKRKLPLIGLEEKSKSSKDKIKDKLGVNPKKDEDSGKKKDEGEEEGEGEGEGEEENKSKSKKVKNFLLGEKSKTTENKSNTATTATAGPGWEIADTSLAQNTLARSEMNAQQMAQKLKAGG